MRHLLPNGEYDKYSIAVLVKKNAFDLKILNKYIMVNLKSTDVIVFDLFEGPNSKTTVKMVREYLSGLLPALMQVGVKYLLVTDSAYFKALTDVKKVSGLYGYVMDCTVKGFEDMKVVLGINPKAFYYDPSKVDLLNQGIEAINDVVSGTYQEVGTDIIHSEYYPETLTEIYASLNRLHEHPVLVCDVETFSLIHHEAGLGTISFAWNKHEGIAFCVDYRAWGDNDEVVNGDYAREITNYNVRSMIKDFLIIYKGKLIYHNASFDIKILIYQLFMKEHRDIKGLLYGLELMTRSIEDTKIIVYLATNSCVGNTLGLKPNSQEFTGNYGEDVTNILKIPKKDLLTYNLKDCLATWYVYDKYKPIMLADNQESIYRTIKIPTIKVCLQMELNGMPMDAWKVGEADRYLSQIRDSCLALIKVSSKFKTYQDKLRKRELVKANLLLKKKQHPLSHFDDFMFNLNSNPQLAGFLYEELGFTITKRTKSGLPATGNKVISELAAQCTDADTKHLLEILVEYAKVNKLLTAFIPAFQKAKVCGNGRSYLHGNFNIGGTVSGRLSCKEPNLQQIPSGTDYAKQIKDAFSAPEGWIMVGADMDSMEDKVSALITRDSAKLKVYTEGYDGHSFRAYYYFGDQMPDIVNTIESINSIKKKYPKLRDKSKAPTFLLTYLGTYHGLMGLGFPEDEAKSIEDNYHRMYQESDEWVDKKIEQATKDGYVDVAFGLRVRTPVLQKSLMGTSVTPHQANAERRTAGNALGQSYGMLNTRAAIEFQERLLASQYREDVLPIAMIHDAIYAVCRDDIEVIQWVNKNLIECMSWGGLPELVHPSIKMSAALDLYYPSWKHAIELPNLAEAIDIFKLADEYVED